MAHRIQKPLCYQIVRPLEQAHDALATAPHQTWNDLAPRRRTSCFDHHRQRQHVALGVELLA
jgi:hypothetical protein